METIAERMAESANAGLADSVKKAICVYLDGLITAAGDPQEKAACQARLEAAIQTYKEGHRTSLDVVSRLFAESAAAA